MKNIMKIIQNFIIRLLRAEIEETVNFFGIRLNKWINLNEKFFKHL